MFWAGAAIALVILVAAMMPSRRAKEIQDAKGALPRDITDRDRAYVVQFSQMFGGRDFTLRAIEGKTMSRRIMDRFGVKSGRLDDRTVLGKRLPELELMILRGPGRYRLTQRALDLAKEMQGTSPD